MEENVKTRKSKKGVIIFLVILLVIILGGVVSYFVLFTPEMIAKRNINSTFKGLELSVKEYYKDSLKYDLSKESLGISGNLTFDSNYKKSGIDLTKLKNYKFNYDLVIDKPNTKASFNMNVKRLNKDYLNINSVTNEKNILIDYGDLFNRTIRMDSDISFKDLELGSSASEEDVLTLLDRTKYFLLDHISKDKITKKFGNFEIGDKKGLYTRVNHNINVDQYSNDYYNFVKDDEKSLKALTNMTGLSKDKLLESLKEELYKEKVDEKNSFDLNIYYKINPLKAKYYEVCDDEDNFIFEVEKNKINITGFSKKEKQLEGYFDKSTSKLYLDYNDKKAKTSMKIDMIIKEESITGIAKFVDGDDEVLFNIDSHNTFRKNNDCKNSSNITINVKNKDLDFKLNVISEMEIKTKVKTKDIKEKNTVDYDKMSQEEQDELSTNAGIKLLGFINEIYPDFLNSFNV